MCGIAGKLSWSSRASEEAVVKMTSQLAHRGPDGAGIYSEERIVLGHRRLAIIDLTEAGKQPMEDSSGMFVITFNGEIYNYLELRKELSSTGSVFNTHTDTEVILEAYKKWGAACLSRLNGMFSFGIWNKTSQELFLARDRLGKKPLFYFEHADGGLSFASELQALLEDKNIDAKIDELAVIQYLQLGYLLTSQCIIFGVKKLPPGHYLERGKGINSAPQPYWKLAESFHSKKHFASIAEAGESLSELLDDSVKIRLMSDVALGSFLSGGLDSSAIVASMIRSQPSKDCLTFSAGFSEKTFSELEDAKEVASYLGVTHKSEIINSELSADFLSTIVQFADEPFADTSMIPMFFLAEFTRKNVTVALSGDGADELFAGYETYAADRYRSFTVVFPKGWSALATKLYSAIAPRDFGKVSRDYKILNFLRSVEASPMRSHFNWREIFSSEDLSELLQPKFANKVSEADSFSEFERFETDVQGCEFLDRTLYVDTKTWLPDDILVKVDRMTMAHSLEARAPFLDYRIVEFAASLPTEMKLSGAAKKVVLKQSPARSIAAIDVIKEESGF